MLKHALALAAVLMVATPATASAGFKEPVHVLWQHTGTPNGYFGWAVSPLADINHDGATDAIIGEPFAGGGTTWVLSGATGAVLRAFHGMPGDENGYAIADAGDVNRDGVDDILSGAPRSQTLDAPGHVYLYSGRDGSLLHTFTGDATPDAFGSAVSSAGDVNRDGHPDLLIGAPSHAGGGIAYVFSGRTYQLLYTIAAPDTTHAFGAGTGTTDDVNGDRVPDEIVGGGGTGYVFSGATGRLLFALPPSAGAKAFGTFFLAGVGDVNHDHVPDIYGGDYAASDNTGFAGVYSGRDGRLLHSWTGAEPNAGLGPGRGAGDLDGDGVNDIAVGSYTSSEGAPLAGKIELYSGATGAKLRTITSTTAGENLGFDAVGVGDVNHDRRPDLLASAAEGDTVYMIAGIPCRR